MPTSTGVRDITRTSELLGTYTRWLLIYWAGVLLLWALGIEAMFEHPTPFIGLFELNFGDSFSFFLLAGTFGFCVVALRSILFPDSQTRNEAIATLAFCALALAISVLLLLLGRESAVAAVQIGWATLRLHFFVIFVFACGFGMLVSLLQFIGWPVSPLSAKEVRWFVAGLFLFCVIFSASMAMTRSGKRGISQAYERTSLEYISDIGKGETIRGLFRDYNQMHPQLSAHSKVHPPGPVAILWLLSYVSGRGAFGLSLATIAFGSLAVFPFFAFAKEVAGQAAAVTASLCFALMPSVVLFTATSADILFMPFTATTAFLFWRAIHRGSTGYALAAGIAYALSSLQTFSLLGLGGFFALTGAWLLVTRKRRFAVVKTAICMIVAFLAVHLAVWLWSGFDVIQCLRLSRTQFDIDQMDIDRWYPRFPGWTFRFVNPLCFVYFAGIPMSVLFFANLFRPAPTQSMIMYVLAGTVFIFNILYIARGEGERSAMYIMPFIALGAGLRLDHTVQKSRNVGPLAATLGFLAFQCWLTETILYNRW